MDGDADPDASQISSISSAVAMFGRDIVNAITVGKSAHQIVYPKGPKGK